MISLIGNRLLLYWEQNCSAVDILITHGPQFMILDQTTYGGYIGCEGLLIKTKKT